MAPPARMQSIALAIKRRILRAAGAGGDPYPRAPAGSHLGPSERHFHDYEAAPLKLAWRESGAGNAADWQKTARAKLAELTGYGAAAQPPEAHDEGIHGLPGGLTRRSIYLRTGPATDIPIHLIADPAQNGPLPVMICLQGTNSGIHLSWGEVRLPADAERIARGSPNALQAAARGYLAVAVEQACFGERRERHLVKPSSDPCIDAANHALLLGRTLCGERAGDVSAVINWLENGANGLHLDMSRLHIMGNSSGGTTALFATALDTRIAAALIGGSVGYFRETIGKRRDPSGQNTIPGILDWMEMDDIVALLAPRPALLFAGREDHIWPFAVTEAVADSARAIYRAFGAGDNLAAAPAEGGHNYHPEVAWPAFEKLLRNSV